MTTYAKYFNISFSFENICGFESSLSNTYLQKGEICSVFCISDIYTNF